MIKAILAIVLMAMFVGCISSEGKYVENTDVVQVYKTYMDDNYYISTDKGLFVTREHLYPAFVANKPYKVNWVQYNVGLPVIVSFNYSRSENGGKTVN